MDTKLPPLLHSVLSGLLDFEMIPSIFDIVLDENEFKDQEPYDLAKDYGIDNNVFLIN